MLALVTAGPLAFADTAPAEPKTGRKIEPSTMSGSGFEIPPECSMSFGEAAPAGPGIVRLSGYVDIECAGSRIQADTVLYDSKQKRGTAEGTVVLDWGENRVTGSRMEFDLSNRTGTMTEAAGWVEPEALLRAETIQKVDEDHVLLVRGEFTTCTQPIPYWSFRVGRGLFHLRHYAHLRHVRMNVGRVPVFYLPWMLWPIKGDRATGLLPPQWGSSSRYGFYAGEAFFLVFSRNADATLYGDYYADGGPAGGLELNWLPDERGRVRLTGYYLKDNERDERRYMGRLQVLQRFGKGWRLGADVNEISDFRYHQDFDRNLSAASANGVLSTINLVRNGEFTSFNARAKAREQFFTSGVGFVRVLREQLDQDTVPEIELRGRSRRLPGVPLYYSFESSADAFRTKSETFFPNGLTQIRESSRWGRLDFEPRLMLPLRPVPWLSLEGRAALRQTYYTSRTIETFERTLTTDPVTGDPIETTTRESEERGSIGRSVYDLQAEVIGPRLYKLFRSDSAFSPAYKHVIEPRLLYRYVPEIREQALVPLFDDRDVASGDLNVVTASLRNRLVAKRPPRITEETARPTQGSETGGVLPWSSFPTPIDAPPAPLPVPVSPESSESPEGDPEGGIESYAGGTTQTGDSPGPGAPADPNVAAAAIAEAAVTPGPAATPPASDPSTVAAPARPETGDKPPPAGWNPVEIGSFEISQSYSFGNPLSTRFETARVCSGGGAPPCPVGEQASDVFVPVAQSHYGPLSFSLHFNPTLSASVDLRSDYDLTNDAFVSNSLSGWYRWRNGYVNTTYYRQTPAGVVDGDSSQIRLGSGAGLFNRKLTLDGDLGYDLRRSTALDRRGRVGYYTQCCGFVVEYLQRDFEGSRRREYRFVVDLKGIGKFLDLGGSTAQ